MDEVGSAVLMVRMDEHDGVDAGGVGKEISEGQVLVGNQGPVS